MTMARFFPTVEEGLRSLVRASFSISQALGLGLENEQAAENFSLTEQEAVRRLAMNAISHRLTGNGVGWGDVNLTVNGYGVEYRTSGGLCFGWRAYFADIDGDVEGWYFYVEHPSAEWREGSTLKEALEKEGFELNKILISAN